MSKMYRNQPSSDQAATSQDDKVNGQQTAADSNGMGNAARVEQMKNSGPRDTTLPFRFSQNNLNKCGAYIQTIERAFRDDKLGLKDGSWLTDSEKLFVVATALKTAGASDTKIAYLINGLFFFAPNATKRQLDSVTVVSITGNQVTVEFQNNNVEGGPAVLPMVFEGSVAHDGRDTNERGNTVDHFQDTGLPLNEDSWLQRNAPTILSGFLAGKGAKFATMDPSIRQKDSGFRQAFYEFEKDISLSFLIQATDKVAKNALDNQRDGDTPAVIRDKAVNDALNYTNKYTYATAHTTLETQDEAIVQRALQEIGLDTDIDTDVQDQRLSKAKKP